MKLIFRLMGVKVAACFCALGPTDAQPTNETVTIYRDGWGVPHIYGQTDRAAAFGLGYAQAQDRLSAVLENFLTATGNRARAFGPDEVDHDFQQHLWRHDQVARSALGSLPPPVAAFVHAFTAGIRHYTETHKDAPAWAPTVAGHHPVALARFIAWRRLLDQADREYTGTGEDGDDILWALSPERSVEDGVVLATDPHGQWHSPMRFYEAHIHGDRLHAWGFTIPGLPVILFGHNRRLGWGLGSGGPDGTDVYEIDLVSSGASRYAYDDKTRTLSIDTLQIAVNRGDTIRSVVRYAQRSDMGPVIHRRGRKAFVYRIPGEGEANQVTQFFAMMQADTFASFYEALATGAIGPSAVLYGDRRGRVHYLRTGRVPMRSETILWHRPVDGNVALTGWLGIHSQDDLVQLVDPSQGWLVDAGNAPDLLTAASPAVPDRYPAYVFNAIPAQTSQRARRLSQILAGGRRLTLREVFDLVYDTYVPESHLWQRALADAWLAHNKESLQAPFDLINRWSGHADPDDYATAFYLTWREACEAKGRAIDEHHIVTRQPLSSITTHALIDALAEAADTHRKRYGRLNIPWREIHRMRIDGRSWGLSGLASNYGASLRRTEVQLEGVVGYGSGGQAAPTVMVFKKRSVASYTAVPFGQSDDRSSPHRWDQAEALFTHHRFRRTRFDDRSHLKLKKVLRVPQDLSNLHSSAGPDSTGD